MWGSSYSKRLRSAALAVERPEQTEPEPRSRVVRSYNGPSTRDRALRNSLSERNIADMSRIFQFMSCRVDFRVGIGLRTVPLREKVSEHRYGGAPPRLCRSSKRPRTRTTPRKCRAAKYRFRHGRHPRRHVHDGQPRERKGPKPRRGPAARGEDSPILDGQMRGDLGRIRPVVEEPKRKPTRTSRRPRKAKPTRRPARRRPTSTRPTATSAKSTRPCA